MRARTVVTGLTAVLLSLLAGAQPAGAGVLRNPTPLSTIGSPGSGHAQLYAWGAATMADGSVIIGDYWNHRVVHYAADGSYLGVLFNLAASPTVYSAPYGLAVDTSGGPYNGDIYIGFEYGAVERFFLGHNGWVRANPRLTAPGMKYPSRVAVGVDGTVYVSDMEANTIWVYNASAIAAGTPSGQFGPSLGAGGQLNQPRAIALDSSSPQRLYIADANNHRVVVLDSSTGAFLTSFGSGIGPDLRGLAIDTRNGYVYVVDDNSQTVHKYTLGGISLGDLGGPFDIPQGRDCCAPAGLFSNGGREATVDGSGNLWVGDMPNFRVQVWDSNGNFLRAVPVTADCDAADQSPACPTNGGFNGVHAMDVTPSGGLIVSDTYNFRTEDLTGTGAWQWSQGIRGRYEYGLDYPMGVRVNPGDGSFYVVDSYNNAVKKFAADGTWVWTYLVAKGPGALNRPEGLALGPSGTLYVADTLHKRVAVLVDQGTGAAYSTAIGVGSLTQPNGVARDPSTGNIFVANGPNVQEFNAAGALVATIGGAGSAAPFQVAYDVVLDGTNLYVSDKRANDVQVYAESNGSYVQTIGSKGSGTDQFNMPLGLALSGNDLYVADSGNDRIVEWCVSSC